MIAIGVTLGKSLNSCLPLQEKEINTYIVGLIETVNIKDGFPYLA